MIPLEEALDLYNARGEPLGITKPRYLVHRDGDWHKSFHCWIIYTDAVGQATLVFQKRGHHVELWPNKLDITAAGHYLAGEGIEGGLRELQEELGITVAAEQLIYAGIRVCVDEFQAGIIDHSFQEVYFLVDDRALLSYAPQKEELDGVVAIQIPLLLQLFAETRDHIVAPGVLAQKGQHGNMLKPHDFVIARADFIPTLDRYYHRVAVLAQRILRGEPYIWI